LRAAIVGHGLEVRNGLLEVGESGALTLTRACCRRGSVLVVGALVGIGRLATTPAATTATLATTASAGAAFAITRGAVGVTRTTGLCVGRLTLRLGLLIRVPRLWPRAITGGVGATGRLCRAPTTVGGASRIAWPRLTRGGGGSRRIWVGHDVLSLSCSCRQESEQVFRLFMAILGGWFLGCFCGFSARISRRRIYLCNRIVQKDFGWLNVCWRGETVSDTAPAHVIW
jgi:hypothetical protein